MADPPSPPWTLRCPWCPYRIVVFARGPRGNDHGSGVEAAQQMKDHAETDHRRTWRDFLAASR